METLYFTLEGAATGTGDYIKFSTDVPKVPDWTVYAPVLEWSGVSGWSLDVRPRDAETSHGLNQITVRDHPDLTGQPTPAVAKVLDYAPTADPSIGQLTVSPEYTGHTGTLVWWQRECLYLGGETDPGVYLVARMLAGTVAADLSGSDELYAASPILDGRILTMYSRVQGTERVLFRARVDDRGHNKGDASKVLYLSDVLTPAKTTAPLQARWEAQVTGRVSAADGAVVQVYGEHTPEEDAWTFTASPMFPSNMVVEFDGSLYPATYVTPATRPVAQFQFNPRATWRGAFRRLDNEALLSDDTIGKPVREALVAEQLGSTAVSVAMALLTSTPSGLNGPWDVGQAIGPGIPIAAFDADAIAAFDAGPGQLARVPRFAVYGTDLDTPTWDYVKSCLAPFGLVWGHNLQGQYTIEHWSETEPQWTLTNADVVGLINQTDGLQEVIDTLAYRFSPAQTAIGDRRRLTIRDADLAGARNSKRTEVDIDAPYVENAVVAYTQATARHDQYSRVMPKISLATGLGTVLPVGSAGTMVLPMARQQDGTRGYTSALARVVSARVSRSAGTIQYIFRVLNEDAPTWRAIGFSCKVTSTTGATCTVEENWYVPVGGNGVYARDTDALTPAGRTVRLLDSTGAVSATCTLTSVTATTVTLDPAPPMGFTGYLVGATAATGPTTEGYFGADTYKG